MNDVLIQDQPLLSICIPTYNRGELLEKLFENLSDIKTCYGRDIEICVSNNCSTDHTHDVIKLWSDRLALHTAVQLNNIGATRNIFEVAKLATGRWLLIIGDDDAIVHSNFGRLMNLLGKMTSKSWVLVGIANEDGAEFLLTGLEDGVYDVRRFRRTCLRRGLSQFGFIGMHVIPCEEFVPVLAASDRYYSNWPHLAILLAYRRLGIIHVLKTPIIEQAGGGKALFWRQGDWMTVSFSKIAIVLQARKGGSGFGCYYLFQSLRELYSISLAKQTILWKVLEPSDFDARAAKEYGDSYRKLEVVSPVAMPHLVALAALRIVPVWLLRWTIRRFGRGAIIEKYENAKSNMAKFDAFTRGL